MLVIPSTHCRRWVGREEKTSGQDIGKLKKAKTVGFVLSAKRSFCLEFFLEKKQVRLFESLLGSILKVWTHTYNMIDEMG